MAWRAGLDTSRSWFNASWLSFTGRTLDQEVGNGWTEGIHPEDVRRCMATLRHHLDDRLPFSMVYRLRRHDGVYRTVCDRGVPYPDATGAFTGFVGTCTEDRSVPTASSGIEDFFERSLDNLCVAGLDGYFKRVNPSWTRTLGWTAEEMLSRPSIEFVHPDDREATLAGRERLRAGSALGPLVNRYLCKDGSHRWFEWRSVANAELGLVYAAARDITEQKQAEERLAEAHARQESLQRQLIVADRMASVGTLAAGVAHEINNPLAAVMANIILIHGDLQALDAEARDPRFRELQEMSSDVRSAAERIQKIVRGLQIFARAEEERRVVVELQPVLELAIDMTFNEIRHRSRLVRDYQEAPVVEADQARLAQVFINLLINAAQALPERDTTTNEIRIRTSTDAAGRAVVEIRDTGHGIPASIRERVFDPFFTTKPVGSGTGLGLSICHGIVTGLGGELDLTSEEGRGTTVRVVLPPARSVPVESDAAPHRAGGAAPRFAVLVVDDDASIGTVLRRILREHDVTAVTTARDALALLQAGREFDVILSDLMMPEMSGMEFYAELRRSVPEVVERLVFVSGGAFTPSGHAFVDRVANPRIAKPFEPADVREVVRRVAGRRRSD